MSNDTAIADIMNMLNVTTPGGAVDEVRGLIETRPVLGIDAQGKLRVAPGMTIGGALQLHGNRRVSVPNVTPGLLDQIAFARLTIEPKLADLAAPNLTGLQITRLEEIDEEINRAMAVNDIPGYLTGNHRFHFTLYEASKAAVLIDIAQSLWLRFGPSLRVVVGRYQSGRMPDRHSEALAILRSGNGPALARIIQSDIQQGIDQVRLALEAGEI